jgi:hypothetical protein
VVSAGSLLLLTASLATLAFRRGNRGVAAILAAAAVAIPGCAVSAQMLFRDATFHYRDAMKAAAPLLDGQVTAGDFSYAFRLYNSSVPVLNPYQYQYSAAGLAEYRADLERLFAEGVASRTVSVPENASTLGELGLHPTSTFAIDAPQSPRFVVFVR